MEGFFTFLFIVIVVFYAYSLIIKLIFKHKLKKLEKEINQDEFESPTSKKQDIHVDPNIGEYTDFEEIE